MEGNNDAAELTTTFQSPSGGDSERIRQESMSDPSDERKYLPPGNPNKEEYRLSTFHVGLPSNDALKTKNVGALAECGFSYNGKNTCCVSCGRKIDLETDDVFSQPGLHATNCLMKTGTEHGNIPLKRSVRKGFLELKNAIQYVPSESDKNVQQNGRSNLQRPPLKDVEEGFDDNASSFLVPGIRDTYIRRRHVTARIRLPSHPEGVESLNAGLGFGEEPKSPTATLMVINRRRRSSSSIDDEEPTAKFRSS